MSDKLKFRGRRFEKQPNWSEERAKAYANNSKVKDPIGLADNLHRIDIAENESKYPEGNNENGEINRYYQSWIQQHATLFPDGPHRRSQPDGEWLHKEFIRNNLIRMEKAKKRIQNTEVKEQIGKMLEEKERRQFPIEHMPDPDEADYYIGSENNRTKVGDSQNPFRLGRQANGKKPPKPKQTFTSL